MFLHLFNSAASPSRHRVVLWLYIVTITSMCPNTQCQNTPLVSLIHVQSQRLCICSCFRALSHLTHSCSISPSLHLLSFQGTVTLSLFMSNLTVPTFLISRHCHTKLIHVQSHCPNISHFKALSHWAYSCPILLSLHLVFVFFLFSFQGTVTLGLFMFNLTVSAFVFCFRFKALSHQTYSWSI